MSSRSASRSKTRSIEERDRWCDLAGIAVEMMGKRMDGGKARAVGYVFKGEDQQLTEEHVVERQEA